MFGTKLRSWMEAHIVRPRRKQSRLNKDNTETTQQPQQQSNNSRRGTLHDDANKQTLTTNHQPAISASTTGSSLQRDASGSSLQRQSQQSSQQQTQVNPGAGGASGAGLSSPESAYSTGYSTDGTSPGAAPPPEYYINIRTGTHYFQHAPNVGPAVAKVGQAHAKALEAVRAAVKTPETVQHKHRRAESCCPPLLQGAGSPFTRAPLQPALKDPIQIVVPPPAVPSRLSDTAPTPSLIVQPPPTITAATASPSPRQRSRIRTNPWMSGSASRSSSVVNCGNTINTTTSGSTCSSSGVGVAAGAESCRLSSSSSSCTAPSGSAAESGAEMPPTVPIAPAAAATSNKFPNGSPAAVSSRHQSPRVSRPGRSPRKNCRPAANSNGTNGKLTSPLVKRSVSACSTSSTSTDEDITPKGRPMPGYPSQYVINNVMNRPRSDVDDEDEDVTLNEMMGKYDESYVYEKETDILSDSDPTDCELDLVGGMGGIDTDTGGEEAGDEDTAFDEMDYIDAECSIASLENKHANTGRCTYHQIVPPSVQLDAAARRRECYLRRSARRRSAKQSEQRARRSKRQRDGSKNRQETIASIHNDEGSRRSSRPAHRSDSGSRSLGGTPLSLRRQKNLAANGDRKRDTSKLATAEIRVKKRSNSVSFAEGVRGAIRCGGMVSFDSETAILEADKEADQKYKELILEAENILVSMKSATPSPRHRPMTTIPANKRVEHLRTTETDLVFLKNRVEDASVPNSPKTARASPRFSPKKNHITNFINSNSPELGRRDYSVNDSPLRRLVTTNVIVNRATSPVHVPICPQSPTVVRKTYTNRLDQDKSGLGSPQVKLNGRILAQSPKRNGFTSTTIHSQMHVLRIDDDSDSCENDLKNDEMNNDVRITLHKTISEKLRVGFERVNGCNRILDSSSSESDGKQNRQKFRKTNNKAPLMTFRSVDMGYSIQDTSYCPQSEPVKRKVYSCSATYDKLQKSLERPEETSVQLSDDENFINDDAEGGLCRTSLRVKVAQLRRERLAAEASAIGNNDNSSNLQQQISQFRRQILLHTLEGLKRSLEDQSASLQQTYREPKENEKVDAAITN